MTADAARGKSAEFRIVRVLLFSWTGVMLGCAGYMAVATQWFAAALGDSHVPQALIVLAVAALAGGLHPSSALSAGLVMCGLLYASSEGDPIAAPIFLAGALVGMGLGSMIRAARRNEQNE
jgi:predicted anti-sigma-YlaC factor YlaD